MHITFCCWRLLCLNSLPLEELSMSCTLVLRVNLACRGRSLSTHTYRDAHSIVTPLIFSVHFQTLCSPSLATLLDVIHPKQQMWKSAAISMLMITCHHMQSVLFPTLKNSPQKQTDPFWLDFHVCLYTWSSLCLSCRCNWTVTSLFFNSWSFVLSDSASCCSCSFSPHTGRQETFCSISTRIVYTHIHT